MILELYPDAVVVLSYQVPTYKASLNSRIVDEIPVEDLKQVIIHSIEPPATP